MNNKNVTKLVKIVICTAVLFFGILLSGILGENIIVLLITLSVAGAVWGYNPSSNEEQ